MSTATQTEQKVPLKTDKSIGARVTQEEFDYIKGLATASGMTMSDWILDRISMTTKIIELKSVVLECLQKRLTDPGLIFELSKREKVKKAIEIIVAI